jgi:type IV pilus assembly protein PilV
MCCRVPDADARRQRCRGITLLEVLVALVVLGIGLLGTAALLAASLRATRTALHRTVAVDLATGLADRIRADRAADTDWRCGVPCDPALAGNPEAAVVLQGWLAEVAAALPEGVGAVDYATGGEDGPGAYEITLRWAEADPAAPAGFSLRVTP